jgi:hypothetical protein
MEVLAKFKANIKDRAQRDRRAKQVAFMGLIDMTRT